MIALRLPRFVRVLDTAKAIAIETAALLGRAGLFVGLAVAGGIGSAWYLTSQPTPLTAQRVGPWVSWLQAGRPDADPYTRARFSRLASLPTSSAVALTFEARTDAGGQNLNAACEYAVEGSPDDKGWWHLGVYTEQGYLIPNPAERHAFTSETVARRLDGGFLITLARDARPGNWLPTGGAGRLVLLLRLDYSPSEIRLEQDGKSELQLPTITRLQCR